MKLEFNLRVDFLIFMVFFLVIPNLATGKEGNGYKAIDKGSLYSRMGGYDVISLVIDDFLVKSWADPKISHFFVGMGTDTRNRLRQKNKNLMCANTGGPCRPINRPLEVVHEGLRITDKDFYIIVDHIMVSLKNLKFKKKNEKKFILSFYLLNLKSCKLVIFLSFSQR